MSIDCAVRFKSEHLSGAKTYTSRTGKEEAVQTDAAKH